MFTITAMDACVVYVRWQVTPGPRPTHTHTHTHTLAPAQPSHTHTHTHTHPHPVRRNTPRGHAIPPFHPCFDRSRRRDVVLLSPHPPVGGFALSSGRCSRASRGGGVRAGAAATRPLSPPPPGRICPPCLRCLKSCSCCVRWRPSLNSSGALGCSTGGGKKMVKIGAGGEAL